MRRRRDRQGPLRALRRRDVPDARRLALPFLRVQDRLLRLVTPNAKCQMADATRRLSSHSAFVIGHLNMDRLESRIDPSSDEFRRNRERMAALVAQLRERTAVVRQDGGGKGIQRYAYAGQLAA